MHSSTASMLSSYGPFGRSKIIKGCTGIVFVTRDGGQMVENVLARSGIDPIQRLLLQSTLNISQRYGDGSLNTLILLDSLLQTWVVQSGNYHGHESVALSSSHQRVLSVTAVEALMSVVKSMESEIRESMVGADCWRIIDDSKWIRGLWLSALTSSSNAAAALTLERLLWEWMGPPHDFSHALSAIHKKCSYALQHFDEIVLGAARDGSVLSDSYCTRVGEMFIEGLCRDHSALPPTASHREYRFICIKQLLQRYDASSTITSKITVETPSLAALVAAPGGRLLQIRRLVATLLESHTCAIFCCDRVEEAELFEISSHGIVVIDCVPEANLHRLCAIARTYSWSSAWEVLEGISAQRISQTMGSQEACNIARFGVMSGMERVLMKAPGTMLRLSGLGTCEGHYEDEGELSTGGNCASDGPIARLVPQLILITNSPAAWAIHARLLRRCLRVAKTSLEGIDETDGAGCIVPGAGAMDMLWSGIWLMVAESVLNSSKTAFGPTESCAGLSDQPDEDTRVAAAASPPMVPLAHSIARHILGKLQGFVGSDGPRFVAMQLRVVSLCRALSTAYLQPPRVLLENSLASNAGPDSASRHAKKLAHWKNLLDCCNQTESTGKAASTDRRHWAGLVASLVPHSGPLSSLCDAYEYGVVGSARQFFNTFVSVLEDCKWYLRVGGQIVMVKKAVPKPRLQQEEEEHDSPIER